MTTKLFDLTLRLARELGIVTEGTASGGTTATLIDTADRTEVDDFWNKGTLWIVRDAGGAGAAPEGEYGYISDFVQTTNTVSVRTALTTAPASGDRYAIATKRFQLQVLVQMINNAIMQLPNILVTDTTSITIAANQTEYNLPAAASQDLRAVYVQTNNDSNANYWVELHNWTVQKSATGTADVLVLPWQPTTGYDVKLVYVGPHAMLYTNSDVLDESVNILRIIYPAAAECCNWWYQRTSDDRYMNAQKRFETLAEQARQNYPVKIPGKAGKIMVVNSDKIEDDYQPYPWSSTVHL